MYAGRSPAGEPRTAPTATGCNAARSLARLSLVPLDDASRDAPAVGDLDAFALGPVTGGLVLRAVATGRRTTSAATAGRHHVTPAEAAGLRYELSKGRSQLLRMLGVEVNFVVHAVEGERQCFVGLTTVDIVEKLDLDCAGHGRAFSYSLETPFQRIIL